MGQVVTLTPSLSFDQFLQSGVIRADQFAICDKIDRLKQMQFDVSSLATNSTVIVKAGASSGTTTITLPASSGTLTATAFGIVQTPTGTSPTATTGNSTLNLTSAGSSGNININGNSSTNTVDISLKSPIVSGGVTSLDWAGRQAVDSTGTPSLDYENRVAFDNLDIGSIDYKNRLLYDTNGAGIVSYDYANRQAFNNGGTLVLDHDACNLIDPLTGIPSLTWTEGVLWANGMTNVLEWNGGIIMSYPSGNVLLYSAAPNTSVMYDDTVNNGIAIDIHNRTLKDINENAALTWTSTSGMTIVNPIVSYNGNTLDGNGLVGVVKKISLAAQSATIGDTTLFTPSVAGLYRLTVYLEVTTAGSAGNLTVQAKYSDENGAQAVNALTATNLVLTGTGFATGIVIIRSVSSVAIKYNVAVNGLAGSLKFNLNGTLERLI